MSLQLKVKIHKSQKGRKITWGDKISKAKKGVTFVARKEIICLSCLKIFEVLIASNRKFCSQKCYQDYYLKDLYCKQCDKIIGRYRKDSKGDWRKSFCSEVCRATHFSENFSHTKESIKKFVDTRRKTSNGAYGFGLMYEPYCSKFNEELKRRIHIRDSNACVMCFDFEVGLDTHHIDYNKKNSKESNLITLCDSCHGKTNSNRNFWTKFFKFNYGVLLHEN